MAERVIRSPLEAILLGINDAVQNFTKLRAARDQIREERELFNIRKKKAQLELNEMLLRSSPERKAFEEKKLKNALKMQELNIKDKELSIQERSKTESDRFKQLFDVGTEFIKAQGTGGFFAGREGEGEFPKISPSSIASGLGLERKIKMTNKGLNVTYETPKKVKEKEKEKLGSLERKTIKNILTDEEGNLRDISREEAIEMVNTQSPQLKALGIDVDTVKSQLQSLPSGTAGKSKKGAAQSFLEGIGESFKIFNPLGGSKNKEEVIESNQVLSQAQIDKLESLKEALSARGKKIPSDDILLEKLRRAGKI